MNGRIQWSLTEEDIEEARKDNSYEDEHWCPIARCVRRTYPDARVTVGGGRISLRGFLPNAHEEWWALPPEAIDFMAQFDDREPVQPFSFTTTLYGRI